MILGIGAVYLVGTLLVSYLFGRFPKETEAPDISGVIVVSVLWPLSLPIQIVMLINSLGKAHSK